MRLTIKSFVVKILLIITVLSLTSCSQVKLAYGFLDNWVRWQINDFVDLNKDQNKIVRAASKEFHRWHRENELVRYSIFLEETMTQLDQPTITSEDVSATLEEINTLLDSSVEQFHDATVTVASTLSDEQIQDTLDILEEEENKTIKAREETTSEERREKGIKNSQKFFAKYLGKLTDEQKQIIADPSQQSQSTYPYWLQRDQQWRKDFKRSITTDLTQPENQQAFIDIVFDYPDHINEEHKRINEYNEKVSHDLIVKLHKTLTQKQKKKLFSKLRRYQNDFLDLAGVSSKEEILKAGI